MSSTTKTLHIIPKADFTTSGGAVNADIFLQELVSASLSVPPEGVQEIASDVQVTLDGLGIAADLTAIDAAAAAHAGAAFADTSQRATSNPVQNAPDATEVELVSLDSGPMKKGSYDLLWYCEHLADTAGGVSQVKCYASINGGGEVEIGQDSSSLQVYDAFSGPFTAQLVDGDSVLIRLVVSKIAGTGNASARRARIFLKQDDG